MKLDSTVALVTGGAHRVGRAIALALAQHGATVIIHYNRSHKQADQTVQELQAYQSAATAIQANLAEVAEAEALIDHAVDHAGRLDLLVCSAGIWGRMPLGSVSVQQWDDLFALNVRSTFFLAQRAAPHLRAAKGSLITITDVGVETTWKNYAPYLASKAALAMLTRNLAHDLAPDVRVNGVAPGPVLLPEDWDDQQREQARRSTLLGRVGSAEDVADAVVYLACARFVSGVIIPVDGGHRLK
jgi:pteridine reductase